jgi:hypothetical protein
MGAQALTHAIETIEWRNSALLTMGEVATTSPLRSMEARFDLSGVLVNYLVLNLSSALNPTYCTLGRGNFDYQSLAVGVFYPVADYICNTSTLIVRIPARKNWNLTLLPWFSAMVMGYQDMVRLGFGYVPDDGLRIVGANEGLGIGDIE